MATAYLTSNDLIASVKRRISFPVSQNTFSEEDILAFANEEMSISQVPSIIEYHEEYFVFNIEVPLVPNKSKYSIPERAIGMKLRNLFWKDGAGNFFEMTRVSQDDKAFFQRNIGANTAIHKFYMESNDIVLTPSVQSSATGNLNFDIFLRPNQLVKNERAAIISNFSQTITLNNASIIVGDTIVIGSATFTAVSGVPSSNQFQIGATSIDTATNLVSSINTNGIGTASNNASATVTIKYKDILFSFTTSNSLGFSIPLTQGVEFTSIPTNIVNSSYIDFLQTKPGHRTRSIDVLIPSNGISGNVITFSSGTVPTDLIVGDYIALQNESIIPQIPPDLHTALAERTAARILAAIGDQAGLAAANMKIQDIENKQGTLLDQRVEGAPQKVTARHSLLRYSGMRSRRRL